MEAIEIIDKETNRLKINRSCTEYALCKSDKHFPKSLKDFSSISRIYECPECKKTFGTDWFLSRKK